jgi:uncharacterized membrane protein YfcA
MKNTAFVYFLVSAFLLYMAVQTALGAWWGRPASGTLWIFLMVIIVSFVFSMLALARSLAQIKYKQFRPSLNWISLVGGILLGLFSGYLALGLTVTMFQ